MISKSGKHIESYGEKDKEIEENSGKKNVDIEKNPSTPPKTEVVEEVEKKAPYVASSPYKPLIPFLQRFLKAMVETEIMKFV